MSNFIPKVVNGTLPEIQDGSMIFDKEAKKIYFDFDGQHQEVKSGEAYAAGEGIKIDNNVISVNDTIAKSADLTSEVTTARAAENTLGTRIDNLTDANIKISNTEIEVNTQAEFNNGIVDEMNNLINNKQNKLPNATQVGQVLKATNTEGGIAWGEAGGSSLPPTDNAKTGNALKVQITPAVYKFTTSIVESETTQDFFINTLSDFDFSGITYDEVDDDGNPIKTILKFNGSLFSNSNDDDGIWGIVASSSFRMFPGIHGLYIAAYDPDEGFVIELPLYLPVDAISAWGVWDWTKGWLFDQTDGEMGLYAQWIKTVFPLDSSISGNTSIYKATQNICKKVLSVIAGKDIRSSFSSANTVEKVSDASTSFKWESALPTGQNDFGQFYVSQFCKQTNLSELKGTCKGIGLDLTKVPDFSYFDTLPLETGEQMLVYTYSGYFVEGNGQGLFLYASTAGETNTYALGLTLALDNSASTAEDFIHFPLYATSACEFDHQFKASSGSTEVFNYHYSFSGAGWAQIESWIGREANWFRINPVGDVSSLWNTVLNFGQCISFEQIDSFGQFIFYPGLDLGNKFRSLKTLGRNLFNSLPGDVEDGYVYTTSNHYKNICTIGYNCATEGTTSYEIPVPILPYSGRKADAILLYDNSSTRTINNVEYRRKYKWLETPLSASNNKVLTYNYSTSSVEWATLEAELPTYDESVIYYNYDPSYITNGFDLSNLEANATYKCYFQGKETVFTIYTNSYSEILHTDAILSVGKNIEVPCYTRLAQTSPDYFKVDYYSDSSWQEASDYGSILHIKRIL